MCFNLKMSVDTQEGEDVSQFDPFWLESKKEKSIVTTWVIPGQEEQPVNLETTTTSSFVDVMSLSTVPIASKTSNPTRLSRPSNTLKPRSSDETKSSMFIPKGVGEPSMALFSQCQSTEALDHQCAMNKEIYTEIVTHKRKYNCHSRQPLSCQTIFRAYKRFLQDVVGVQEIKASPETEEILFLEWKKQFLNPIEDLLRIEFCRKIDLQERHQQKTLEMQQQLQEHIEKVEQQTIQRQEEQLQQLKEIQELQSLI